VTWHSRIAAVVIGRNEGPQLAAALGSVQAARLPLVYVDSGSTDGSPTLATKLGVPVIELDPVRPFSAARGRNEGVAEVVRRWPDVEYVLFLDGDCVLDPGFPTAAIDTLDAHDDCAIVTGHLSERHREASIYNRMCAIEWRSPAGPMEDINGLGGIMVIRLSAFLGVGGFDEKAIAGEEPDLGNRLRLAGHSIIKIDRPMASHDARMLRFGQWWSRAVRAGHAMAHRYATHGRTDVRDAVRETRSAIFWGFLLPLMILLLLWPTRGLSLLLLGTYGLLGWRIYRHYKGTGVSDSDSALMGRFLIYAKFAEVLGILRYCLNRVRGRFHIIEWK
jgi:GT2 family glycosyltransferase